MHKISLLLLTIFLSTLTFSQTKSKNPNIIIVLTDDSGYSDLGIIGGQIATPNIDHLYQNGLVFKNCYNNARCSPTRASLLTGQDNHTVGVGDLCRPTEETPYPGYMGYLNPDFPTLPQLLKKAGYHTIMSGKWHLGGENVLSGIYENGFLKPKPGEYKKWPLQRGFDKFFGLIYGMTGTFKPFPTRPYVEGERIFDTESYPGGFYASNAITDFALKYIDEARKKDDNPFLLYLSYTAPHTPVEAPKEYVDKYLNCFNSVEKIDAVRKVRYEHMLKNGLVPDTWQLNTNYVTKRFINRDYAKDTAYLNFIGNYLATYAAMVDIVDVNIGRLIQKLKEMGELENTIIMYMSDNGPIAPGPGDLFSSPYFGTKSSLREGGVKTPMIVYWPGKIAKPGTITKKQVHVYDVLPTLLELTGLKYPAHNKAGKNLPAMEGNSFLPELLGKPSLEYREFMFWDLYGQKAGIYNGRWKWYQNTQNKDFLFDLIVDGTETNSVAGSHDDIVKLMNTEFKKYAERTHVMPVEVIQKEIIKNRIRLFGNADKETDVE